MTGQDVQSIRFGEDMNRILTVFVMTIRISVVPRVQARSIWMEQ